MTEPTTPEVPHSDPLRTFRWVPVIDAADLSERWVLADPVVPQVLGWPGEDDPDHEPDKIIRVAE